MDYQSYSQVEWVIAQSDLSRSGRQVNATVAVSHSVALHVLGAYITNDSKDHIGDVKLQAITEWNLRRASAWRIRWTN